ncbi:MAG: hypothetical protein C4295_09700 [Candidatus Fervidibacterota bacterium]
MSETDVAEVRLLVTPREFCLLFFGAVSPWEWRHLLAPKGIALTDEQTAPFRLLGGDHVKPARTSFRLFFGC